MIELRVGKVEEIISHRPALTKVKLRVGEEIKQGINYDRLSGTIEVGDRVIVNTSATSLNLGTGGYDFIVHILGKEQSLASQGHIMKLRYTPYQVQTCSIAEQQSDNHEELLELDSLEGTPVVVGTLHSMLAPIMAVVKARRPETKTAYIMTDGAALPLALSELVYELQSLGLLDLTVTSGHAFGGQIEAVNIYSALLGSYLKEADIIVVTMGPGIVGTGTKYAFSGTEQADILAAVQNLAGLPIAVPRINFADNRERHYGLSHHSRTNLGELVLVESLVGIPKFSGKEKRVLTRQLKESGIVDKHQLIYRAQQEVTEVLENLELKLTTMGRDYSEVPEYFITAGLAGGIAVEKLRE
ncbi:MAG: DUF3866 family protein [Halanaerobacter sp.]